MTTIENKYNALKNKYGLPDYNVLNNNFMIEDIDSESKLILAKIRIKIHEKIEYYIKIIESILQPDSNLSSMYEAHYIDDKKKEQLYLLFKKLMNIIRNSNLASINNTDELNAVFIKNSYGKWSLLKDEIEKLIRNLSEVWKKETDIKNDSSYFG